MIPRNVNIYDWCSSLIIDFPADNVPILLDENEWKQWGNFLIEQKSFAINGAPTTGDYDDWQKWAQNLFAAMSNF